MTIKPKTVGRHQVIVANSTDRLVINTMIRIHKNGDKELIKNNQLVSSFHKFCKRIDGQKIWT